MNYLEIIARLEEQPDKEPHLSQTASIPKERLESVPHGNILEASRDPKGSILAVRIVGSVIGEFWFCLSDTEPFAPGDNLPVYRPSEVKALKGEHYSADTLRTIHRAKVILEGQIVKPRKGDCHRANGE